MPTPSIPRLAEKAEKLLGIDISIAPSGRAYYYADETSEGYWLTRADLAYAADCAAEHGSDAYSHWCAGTGTPMSARSMRALGLA
jgi:hypothetical protein